MDDWGPDALWQAFGCASVIAISVVLAAIDTFALVVTFTELLDIDDGAPQLFAASLVLLLLSTALPPILRRLQRAAAVPRRAADDGIRFVLGEVEAIAGTIARLNESPSPQSPQIRREVQRLQELVRSFQS